MPLNEQRPGVAVYAVDTTSDPSRLPSTKRLLLVKLGAIGDVIMAIPAAKVMRDQGFTIDWVTSDLVAPVLGLYPWINVLPVNEEHLLRGKLVQQGGGLLRLWRCLRERVQRFGLYDTVAILYYDNRYRLLALPIRANRKVSLSRTNRNGALLPGRHHTDEYARILSGRRDGETPMQLSPIPISVLPLPQRFKPSGRPRIVIVPAGARNVLRDDALRRWPIQHYVALAGSLLGQGCEIVLAGGPDDGWATQHFATLASTAAPGSFADRIGFTSLVETLSLLESAAVTVTHDTGPLHLAGLTSTAIVTVFGPTDPHGRLPQRANAVALWGGSGFACRPCYDGREYAPCTRNGCMNQVTPAMVLEQVNIMLHVRSEGRALPPRVLAPGHAGLVQLGGAM